MLIKSKLKNINGVTLGLDKAIIFTHVGVGDSISNLDEAILYEKKKIEASIKYGTDIICDVSMHDNIPYIHKRLLEGLEIPFATVSIYEIYILGKKQNVVDKNFFLKIIEDECKRGVDIITLHATVFKNDSKLFKETKRIIPSTSRGGILMLELLEKYNMENPFYTCFDEILDICKEYNVSISLGPTYRPASVCDALIEDLHYLEIDRMSDLCKMALDKGVGIMVEGLGHATIDQIPKIIKYTKEKCYNVPYRCMMVSTDVALGYDHISSSIAHSVALLNGADSITCVTRSEHLGIPTLEDTIEGVIASNIARHSAYIAKTHDTKLDRKMSESRKHNGCIGNINYCLFKDDVKKYYNERKTSCTMCGKYCPLKKELEKDHGIL